MYQKNLLWGILLFALFFASPLPAIAQTPDTRPIANPGNSPSGSNTGKSLTFHQVWTLIQDAQRTHSSHFSPELIACLMWEESGFRLVENPQSHALGLGQVMPATLNAVNRRFKTNLTRTALLTSPEASVQATILALELSYEWKKDKLHALIAYAGGMQNYRSVLKWLLAEPQMVQARWADASVSYTTRANASAQMIRGMQVCSQPGYNPQSVF